MVRMPAFGLDGPWRDRPGFAQTMEQVTGLAWMTGYADDQPRIQRGPAIRMPGMHAAFAALVALARRDRTGVGCLVEVADVRSCARHRGRARRSSRPRTGTASHATATAVRPRRRRACTRARDPTRGLRSRSTPTSSGVRSRTWSTARSSPTIHHSRPAPARRRHHDRIDTAIAAWAARARRRRRGDPAQPRGCPCGSTSSIPDSRPSSRRAAARGYFERIEHPVAGTHPTPTLPWRARGVDRWIRRPGAAARAQHNAEVLGGRLGCDQTTSSTRSTPTA